MRWLLIPLVAATTLAAAATARWVRVADEGARAEERTVTFAVDKMYCAACPYIVRETMQAVDGVRTVEVSYRQRRATVTFDDARTSIATIAQASARAGYPADPVPGS